jgi:hypothetical protein
MWKMFQNFLICQLAMPKSKFKSSDWKHLVKEEINKKENLSIKWRNK